MEPALLNPLIFTSVQNTYIAQLSHLFLEISRHASSLFYILASLELALFGVIWALRQQEMVASFLLKMIKLGFIFFLITHYVSLLNILLNGLTQLSFHTGSTQTPHFIFSPDLLWKYGFDSAISLLALAVQYGSANFGMTCIYLVLGFGILLLFALIACQIILQFISFYLLSLLALLFLPFGTLSLTQNLCARSLQAVFQTAVKIFALLLMLGIGVSIWSSFNPTAFSASTSLDQPLGLLFTTLIIAILSWKVPAYAAAAVGHFEGFSFKTEGAESPSPSSSASPSMLAMSSSPAAASQMAAATHIQPFASSTQSRSMPPSPPTFSVKTGSDVGKNVNALNESISELTQAVKIKRKTDP